MSMNAYSYLERRELHFYTAVSRTRIGNCQTITAVELKVAPPFHGKTQTCNFKCSPGIFLQHTHLGKNISFQTTCNQKRYRQLHNFILPQVRTTLHSVTIFR